MSLRIHSATPPIFPKPNPSDVGAPGLAGVEQESLVSAREQDRIEISGELENREQKEGRRRFLTYENEEVRQFPSLEEVVTFKEQVLEEDGEKVLLSVSITKEQIQLNPEEASEAQAGLNPQRLLKLLED